MPHKDAKQRARYQAEYRSKNRSLLREKARAYRLANPEKVKAAKKRCWERIKDDPEHKAKVSAYMKRRRRSQRKHVKAIEKRSRAKHADAIRARQRSKYHLPETKARGAVNRAIRAGRLEKASTYRCVECGMVAGVYHHHLGYGKANWLEVIPMCHMCHRHHHDTWPRGSQAQCK